MKLNFFFGEIKVLKIFFSTAKHGSLMGCNSIHDNWLIGLSAQNMHFVSIFVALLLFLVCFVAAEPCFVSLAFLSLPAFYIPSNEWRGEDYCVRQKLCLLKFSKFIFLTFDDFEYLLCVIWMTFRNHEHKLFDIWKGNSFNKNIFGSTKYLKNMFGVIPEKRSFKNDHSSEH